MGIKLLEAVSDAKNGNAVPAKTPVKQEEKTQTAPKTSDSGGNGNGAKETSTQYVDKVLNSSLFENENQANSNGVQKNANQSQEQILQKLRDAGIKTTKISYEKGETDFAQYTAALDDELKKEIVASFDCEADYILQQEVLSLFQSHHSMGTGKFKSTLAAMGYKITTKNVKTGMLTNWKSNDPSKYERHTIQLISIQDPKTGAEIKIADTNGNGYIEVEEVVANEFLTGIAAQIDTNNLKNVQTVNTAATAGGTSTALGINTLTSGGADNITTQSAKTGSVGQQTVTQDGKMKLNEKQYKALKEKIKKYFVDEGYDEATASAKASTYLQVRYIISDDAKVVSNLEKIAKSIAA